MRDDIDWAEKYKFQCQSKRFTKRAQSVITASSNNDSSSSDDSILLPPRCQTNDDLEPYQHIFDSNECKVLSTKTFPAKLSRRCHFCHVCQYVLQNDVLGGIVACTTHDV
jgi:hypothetical protein